MNNGLILSVRGSEPTASQAFMDYVETDANFLNSDITAQEQALYQYIDGELSDLMFEKHYSNLATTGHSLGGYLSFSAAAHMASSNPMLYSIFMQGTNIDGPGTTLENLEANADVYALIKDKCTHYHYSVVGSILNSICDDDHYISIKGASDWQAYATQGNFTPNAYINGSTISQLNSLLGYLTGNLKKHTLPSLHFDENGNFDTDAVAPPTYPQYNFSASGTNSPLVGGLNIILQTSAYMLECWLVELEENDSGEDGLARIVSTITGGADRNNVVQIVAGSLIETVCEGYYCIFGQDGIAEAIHELQEDIVEEGECRKRVLDCLKDTLVDFAFAISPALAGNQNTGVNQGQTGAVNYWSAFITDVGELKDAVVDHFSAQGNVVESAGEVGRGILNLVGVVVSNQVNAAAEVAREVTISTAEKYRNTIMAGTNQIINKVESWNAYEQCINAQKQMTLNWNTHMSEIENRVQNLASQNFSVRLCSNSGITFLQ